MDLLSLQGAQMSVETVRLLNDYYKMNIGIVGFLPTQVNTRLQVTATVSTRRVRRRQTIPLHSMRLHDVSRRRGVARRKKLEPIRLEDLENNPCAFGLDKVLRFEVPPIRDFPAPVAVSPGIVSTPVDAGTGAIADENSPVDIGSIVATPVDISSLPPALEPRLFLARTRKRLFRPLRAEDAHTDGETRLYQFMWEAGREHGPGIRVDTGSMTSLARALGRADRNTRPVVESLIRKFSIAVAREHDFHTGHPRMYFVFDPAQIAARRRKAGLEWAVKNKGIRLLTATEAAVLAAADQEHPPVESASVVFNPGVYNRYVSTPVK